MDLSRRQWLFETVAAAGGGTRLYQLYLESDQGWMDAVIERVIAAGYAALCLTVDTAVYSRRERDVERGFAPPSAVRAILDKVRTDERGALNPDEAGQVAAPTASARRIRRSPRRRPMRRRRPQSSAFRWS